MSEEIVSYLEIISESFDRYFATRNLEISEEWIINPWKIKSLSKILLICRQVELLKCKLKARLEDFQCTALNMFKDLVENNSVFIPFAIWFHYFFYQSKQNLGII